MKRNILLISLLILFSSLVLFPRSVGRAESNESELIYYDQSEELCYTGCAAWKLYWKHNSLWGYIEEYCTMDTKDAAKTLIKFAFNTARSSVDFGPFIQSLYCAGIINMGIQPILEQCSQTCQNNMWAYAPNLIVTRQQGSPYPGVFYFADKEQLQISVYNGGNVYSPAFKVNVYEADTTERDCEVDGWEKIASYTIDELAPTAVSRNDLAIPSENVKIIDWSAPVDKCSKIKVVVDPDNRIPELDESDGPAKSNTYIYTINNLPEPPRYQIEDISHELFEDNLDAIKLSFNLKNTGEELGRPRVEVRDCYGQQTLRAAQQRIDVSPGETEKMEFTIKNLFWPDGPQRFDHRCLLIKAFDDNNVDSRQYYLDLYAASIEGNVKDMRGQPVAGASVKLSDGSQTTTDAHGNYSLLGITKRGPLTITVEHPDYDYTAQQAVDLVLNPDPRDFMQEGLNLVNVDLLLTEETASLKINCPVTGYTYRLQGKAFSYHGLAQQNPETLGAIVSGHYQLVLNKPGYNTVVTSFDISKGEEKTVSCNLEPLQVYYHDDGVIFEPHFNELWHYKLSSNYSPRAAAISPDGSTIYLAICDPRRNKDCQLVILDRTGQRLAQLILPQKLPVSNIYLRPDYNGTRVLVDDYLIVSRQGQIIAQREKGLNVRGVFAWDGSLVCSSSGLYSSGFAPIFTGFFDLEMDNPHSRCRFGQPAAFTPDQAVLSRCEKTAAGLCKVSFWSGTQTPVLNLGPHAEYWRPAITPDGQTLLVPAAAGQPRRKQLVYLSRGRAVWQQEIEYGNGRAALSPSGQYAVYLEPHGHDFSLYIFDREGHNLLADVPPADKWQWEHDFYDVQPTGQGIFYLKYGSDRLIHFGVLGTQADNQKQPYFHSGQATQSTTATTTGNHTSGSSAEAHQAEASQQTQSWLGRLWQAVKSFITNLFSWLFK